MSKAKNLEEGVALMKKQAENTRSWANMMNEENAKALPMGPSSAPATYQSKTYLPGAANWAAKQETIAEEASAERAETPTPQRNSNIEDIERNKRSYDRYRERMGLPPRPNKTPSRERRRRNAEKARTARRRRSPSPRRRSPSPRRRSPSPRRRSRSPVRRYGVGRRYVAAPGFGSRRRSPSPRRRSPSPRRRSPSPRYSRRRSPSVNEFGRNMTRNYRPRRQSPRGSRNASPLRYTVTEDGRTVNEFGRDIPARPSARGSRFNTRRQRRPIHVFDEKTQTYKPANWNI